MKKLTLIIAGLALSITAMAQDSFVVATGDAKAGSTYSQMYRELAARCSRELPLAEQTSTGSVQNLDLLTGNQVNAAVVQTDMLFFVKMTDESKVTNVRTLFALHPEELHFIARADVKKEGGFMGIGSTAVTFNTVADLKGRTVGAVGGSVISGRVFSAQSGLNFRVVEYSDNNALKQDLLEGKLDTILVVGGAPHKLVQSLDQRFRLLAVDQPTQVRVQAVYSPVKLSYTNLGQAGVPTVSTQAALVTRVYRSPATQASLAKFRACFENQLPNIQDAKGTHAKWQLVDSANKGKWQWYDLPAVK